MFQLGVVLCTDEYYTGYYTAPIELIDGLLDVTKKAILAQIEWTEKFLVTVFSFCVHLMITVLSLDK